MLGINCYSALESYSRGSAPLDNGLGPVASLEPLRDFFVPILRFSYLYPSVLLPVVFSGIISRRDTPGRFNFIGQFLGIGRTLGAKIMAGMLFYLLLLGLSLPVVYYWIMVGGECYREELALLYGGYVLYGFFLLALTIFFSSFIKNRFVVSFIGAVIIGLLLGHDFFVEMTSSNSYLNGWTLSSIMGFFEKGALFLPAMAYFAIPSVIMFLLGNALLMIGGRKKNIILTLILFLGIFAVGGAVTAVNLGMAGEAIDVSNHEHIEAVSWVSLNGEQQAAQYQPFAVNVTEFKAVMPEQYGHPLVISESDQRDILVLYWGVMPLLFVFFQLVNILKKTGISRTGKRFIAAPATWLVIMISLALVQDFYIKNRPWKIFPSAKEVVPRTVYDFGSKFIFSRDMLSEKKAPVEKTVSGKSDPNYIYAGKEYQHLQRFFKKLSDLQAHRRNKVHIVHYGDSLIWGDCYTKTMKRQFQNDFGDGGRGVVPPVETMATALHDHVNRTRAGGFSQHAIRHEFRYLGRFYIRPQMNPLIGFTGEGTFVRSPQSEIRMEAPSGSARWKEVRLFLRSPEIAAGPSECRATLDYGGGKEEKILKLNPGLTGALAWTMPGSEKISISFNGTAGPLPSVDAVSVESGGGVVYSTIVRMGIHMAWMNAVPESHLKPLAEIKPDLLIFQFGINEAASLGAFPEFTKEELRSQMREWLVKMKRLLPETDILLIGPPERLQNYQGGLAVMKETLAVREVQREEAERAGIAFFDTYESLGGEGHMLTMANTGLAMKDYTHFTMRGGDTAAEGLYTSLMNAFRKKSERPKIDFKAEEKTAILFNSASFAYFFGIVIIVAFLLRRWPVARFGFLLAVSYYFYATWKLWPLACLAATTVTDYSMARLINRSRDRGGRGTAYLAVSVAVNLGILFTLKYFDFFSDLTGKAVNLLGYQMSVPILNILLPVGISFYTFQSLSYTIDVWRGNLKPEKNIITYAHYVSLFTQLLAGPIVKARDFLPALKDRASHFLVTHEQVSTALFLILTGLLKKTGADWLAGSIVDRVYASPHMFLPLETLTAVYAYGLQIYGDFSGYSDMAIGAAMLLGYNLTENFRRPYASSSVTEFWQRWHISLGAWLRDYLYISLGGNRKRTLLNIGITMFLCGLWHGAAIPFVIWGLYHGFFMIVERIFKLNKMKTANPLFHGVRVFITLHAVLFGWIIFRSDSWETFTGILNSLVRIKAGAPNVGIVLVLVMAAFYAIHFTPVAWKERLRSSWAAMPATVQGLAASCVTFFIYNIAIAEVKPFIYFQF
ncbi:MAG: hypothetical protein KA369_03275 [Spirochaetes bacterium]|nr:hypothetical protein [Spirochaetota bacterium]